jgi:hypothetical protein
MPLLTDGAARSVAGWNPLLPPVEGAQVDRAGVTVRALTVAAGCPQSGQAAALLDAAVGTLRALTAFLPHELTPTLFQVARLIADEAWRDSVLPVVDAPTRRFWIEVLPNIDSDVVGSVVDLIRQLEDDAAAVALLGQPDTTYDPYPLLADGATLVLSGGDSPLDDALAALLWFDVSGAVRVLDALGSRPAPVLVGTGAHRYGSDRDDLFAQDLAATVQSGARVVLLTDRPDRHGVEARRAVRGLATVVAVDTVDIGVGVAAQWLRVGGESELRATLDALDVNECLVAAARDGWRPRPVDAGRAVRHAAAGGLRSEAEGSTGMTLDEVRARLEGLEDRIAEHLSAPPRPPTPADDHPDKGGSSNVVLLDPSRGKFK